MNWTEEQVAACGKAQPVAPRNKYGVAKPEDRTYKGIRFHSKKEALYAWRLDILIKAGAVSGYERQVPYDLKVKDTVVCRIEVDFMVNYADGRTVLTEVKGYATREWLIKWRLFRALYPELLTEVVKG